MTTPCRTTAPSLGSEGATHTLEAGTKSMSNSKRPAQAAHDEETPMASGPHGEHKHKRRRPDDTATSPPSHTTDKTNTHPSDTARMQNDNRTASLDPEKRQETENDSSADRTTLSRKLEFANDMLQATPGLDEEKYELSSDTNVTMKMNAGSPQLNSSNTKSDISSVRLTHATSVVSSHIHLDTAGRKATISTQNSSHSTLATKKSDGSRRATRRGKMLTERQQYVSELLFQHRQHFN